MVDDIKPGNDKLQLIHGIVDIIDELSINLFNQTGEERNNCLAKFDSTYDPTQLEGAIDKLYKSMKDIKSDYRSISEDKQKEQQQETLEGRPSERRGARSTAIKKVCLKEFNEYKYKN